MVLQCAHRASKRLYQVEDKARRLRCKQGDPPDDGKLKPKGAVYHVIGDNEALPTDGKHKTIKRIRLPGLIEVLSVGAMPCA
eukprot:9904625-Lingulodinium_polyedra.AAC.1